LAASAIALLLEMLLPPISLNCSPKKLTDINHFGQATYSATIQSIKTIGWFKICW
jgi:hypothetical protein